MLVKLDFDVVVYLQSNKGWNCENNIFVRMGSVDIHLRRAIEKVLTECGVLMIGFKNILTQ